MAGEPCAATTVDRPQPVPVKRPPRPRHRRLPEVGEWAGRNGTERALVAPPCRATQVSKTVETSLESNPQT